MNELLSFSVLHMPTLHCTEQCITGDMLYTQWMNEEVVEQITTALAKLPCEQLHLSFLKWTLNTHKQTNNCAVCSMG